MYLVRNSVIFGLVRSFVFLVHILTNTSSKCKITIELKQKLTKLITMKLFSFIVLSYSVRYGHVNTVNLFYS